MKFYYLWNLWYALKYAWQRRTRGYADKDLWNADYAIAKHALPIVKAIRADTYCHPSGMTADEWKDTLGEIVYGLEYVVRDGDDAFFEGDYERAQAGLVLFGRWFMALWS